jgi:hypothetical protein
LHDVEVVDDSLPSRSSCWQDVINAIESATAQDNAKADKSFLRARLRKSGPELAVLESLTNMIPDQDGLSILRGGLATLCKVRAFIVSVIEATPSAAGTESMRFTDGHLAAGDARKNPRSV